MSSQWEINVNTLFKYKVDKNDVIERVLYIYPDRSRVFTISLSEKKPFPVLRKFSEIKEGLENGAYSTDVVDPYAILMNPSSEYLKKYGDDLEEKWNLIKDLVENEPAAYDRAFRGEFIADLISRSKKSKSLIYKYLRYYWTGGKIKYALLPHYFKCGKLDDPDKKRKNEVKVGKRNIRAIRNKDDPKLVGIVITDEIKRKMTASLSQWYKKTAKNSLEFVHEQMWHTYFLEEVIVDGVTHKVPMPSYKVPTIDQLRYHYEQTEEYKEILIAREGVRNFNLRYRPVLGNATRRAAGPGSIYEIDATVGDIYLVSHKDRTKVIGRPVIYLVIDVFSRMIVGFYVGLEGPSWQGAMMALENATTNKVEFCAEYDIHIEEPQWPVHHLPEVIIGDRGELESKNADSLTASLGIVIKNEPPYRADWKGIVESSFKTVNTTIKKWAPGAVQPDFKMRGGKDYVLDAKMSLRGFIKLMIHYILFHNNNKIINNYPLDTSMIPDSVIAVPIHLWNWGIENRAGHLRILSRDIIRLNILPSRNVVANRLGITLEGIHYKSDELIDAGYFIRGDSRSVTVAYDRRCMNHVYVKKPDGLGFYKCNLAETSDRFTDLSLEEIKLLQEEEKLAIAEYKDIQNQAKYKMNKKIEEITKEEIALSEQARANTDITNTEFKADIQGKRAVDRRELQSNQAFVLGVEENPIRVVHDNLIAEDTHSDVGQGVKGMSLLEKLRRKKSEEIEDED